MAATVASGTAPGRGQPESTSQPAADLFVVSGITGDLAKEHGYAPASWGPSAADELAAETGGWHGPWVAS